MRENDGWVILPRSETGIRLPVFGEIRQDNRSVYTAPWNNAQSLGPNFNLNGRDALELEAQYELWREVLSENAEQLYQHWRELHPDVLQAEFDAWLEGLKPEDILNLLSHPASLSDTEQKTSAPVGADVLQADAVHYKQFLEGQYRVALYLNGTTEAGSAVARFAADHKLEISYQDDGVVILSGAKNAFETAFQTEIIPVDGGNLLLRNREGDLLIPTGIEPHVFAVSNLNQSRLLDLHRVSPRGNNVVLAELMREAGFGQQSQSPDAKEVATGKGQTIALLAPVTASAMIQYCIEHNMPVSRNGASQTLQIANFSPIAFHANHLQEPHSSLSEDSLAENCRATLEQLRLLSAMTEARIIVYEFPPTIQGLVNAANSAVHNPFNSSDVIVINHGARPHDSTGWEEAERVLIERVISEAAEKGNRPVIIVPKVQLTDNRLKQKELLVPVTTPGDNVLVADMALHVIVSGQKPIVNAGTIVAAAGAAVLRSSYRNDATITTNLERFVGMRSGMPPVNANANLGAALPPRNLLEFPGAKIA